MFSAGKPVTRQLAMAALLIAQPLIGCAAEPAITMPRNDNIVRWSRGTYDYLTLEDRKLRGSERFQMMVHPDGSRTMLMWNDLAATNTQFSVVLRVDGAFRPLEAYLNYWVDSGYKGSAYLRVNGDSLQINSQGPAGQHQKTVEVPPQFSIGTHPVAGDGWHLYQQRSADGSRSARIYSMEASKDLTKPLLGTLVDLPFERVGKETIVTPAGTFETTHYRMAGLSDLWLAEEDRLMVRMVIERRGFEYLLTQYSHGGAR